MVIEAGSYLCQHFRKLGQELTTKTHFRIAHVDIKLYKLLSKTERRYEKHQTESGRGDGQGDME